MSTPSPSAAPAHESFTAANGVTLGVAPGHAFALGARTVTLDACALQGRRPYMEDRWTAAQTTAGGALVLAVFDGHGGASVAQALADQLPSALLAALAAGGDADVAACVTRCFLNADAALVKEDLASAPRSQRVPGPGSTAAVAVLLPGDDAVWLANVGDARAVLADERGALLAVTVDQTPAVAAEHARILARGGTVSSDRDHKLRACGILAISRAFGNAGIKDVVTAEPAVQRVPLPRGGCSLLIASDGLFDVLSSEEAMRTVHGRARAPATTVALRAKGQPRAGDNITALVAHIGAAPGAQDATPPLATQPPEALPALATQPPGSQASAEAGAAPQASPPPRVDAAEAVAAAAPPAPAAPSPRVAATKRTLTAMLLSSAALPAAPTPAPALTA